MDRAFIKRHLKKPDVLIAVMDALDEMGVEYEFYSLISNHGIQFKYRGREFDMRYWANCYGNAINEYMIGSYVMDDKVNAKDLTVFLDQYIIKFLSKTTVTFK